MSVHMKFYKDESIRPSSTIIVATPNHGNMAQLAIDCVIATLAKKNFVHRIGVAESGLLVPMTGYEQYCEEWGNTLCAPVEVYQVDLPGTSPLYLVLQRSPCFENSIDSYAKDFVQYLSQFQPSSLIFTAGCSNNAILDIPTSSRFVHLQSSVSDSVGLDMTSLLLNSTALPLEAVLAASQNPDSPLSFLDMDTPLAMLQATSASTPATLVACCCEEGINFNDGKMFGEKLLAALGVKDEVLIPQSWRVLLQPPAVSEFGLMF